eukprot:TRINITY_DN7215_c0_g1_i18.p1 TRINITY_DN7215_c0_g1~~TRINITY_DN7215_c0_g1_i18.p1  ORF type:complete len:549 (-),score=98.64 TRINITY_DN7215_c0_g1_i18:740-2353(-)
MGSYQVDFISIGCNRVSGCTHWGSNKILAYGAGRFISLYDVEDGKITNTLSGHLGRVNAVRWIPPEIGVEETELISVCSAGHVIVWKKSGEKWNIETKFEQHKGHSVTGLDVVMSCSGILWVVTCSDDNTVRIWKRGSPKEGCLWNYIATLDHFKPHLAECVAVEMILPEIPIFAAGSVSTKIELFCVINDEVLPLVQLQGHEDWIRSLSFTSTDDGNLLLASAGQDKRVRLWKIVRSSERASSGSDSATLLSKLTELKSNDNFVDVVQVFSYHQHLRSFKIPLKRYGVGGVVQEEDTRWSVLLESVLVGHEDWVSQVVWQRPHVTDEGVHQQLKLLSSSMDATMIIWEPDADSGLWLETVRVGEVGGNLMGFFGGCFGPPDKHPSIIAHGWTGAFHLWKHLEDGWSPRVTVSGHFDEVRAIAWDPNSQYLISVSKDQTTRLWSKWLRPSGYYPKERRESWNEIARPQVHGYDLMCLCFVSGTLHRFVSGAEEKILRVFDAPQTFVDTLKNLSNLSCSTQVWVSFTLLIGYFSLTYI